MVWLEYLLPLIFLLPMAAMGAVVVGLRGLYDARVQSPYDARPLRLPGQALRNRLNKAFSALFLNAALGPLISLAPLVYGMGRMLFAARQNWIEWAFYGLLSTLLVVMFSLLLIRDYQRIRRLKLGVACEMAVGQELEHLQRPEVPPYHVFHDVPTDTFTIDHVVVTPHGVFVIETRARTAAINLEGRVVKQVHVEAERLRFPNWQERRPLYKTRQAVAWLDQWLASRGLRDVPMLGVLVLPGWHINSDASRGDISVVSGEALARYLLDYRVGDLRQQTHDDLIQHLSERVQQSHEAGVILREPSA